MKRILAMLVLAALVLSASACGKAEEAAEAVSDAAEAAGEAVEEAVDNAAEAVGDAAEAVTEAVEEAKEAVTEPEPEPEPEKPKVDEFWCPGATATEQGEDGWYYYTYKDGEYLEMEMLPDGYWKGVNEWNRVHSGTLHPDTDETVVGFEVPENGTAEIEFNFGVGDAQSTGVMIQVRNGDNLIYPAESENGYQLINGGDSVYEDLEGISVKAGDMIYFVFNINVESYYDTTSYDISIYITPEE